MKNSWLAELVYILKIAFAMFLVIFILIKLFGG